MSAASERMKELRRSRIARGLCGKCGLRKRKRKKTSCEPCLVVQRERNAKRLERAREAGRCAKCMVDTPSPGRAVCDGCLETLRKRYVGRVQSGLCGVCGSESQRPTCDDCLVSNRLRTRRRYQRLRYAMNHTCNECGGWKSAVESSVCQTCKMLIRGPLPILRAMAMCGWSTVYDLARETSLTTRAVYRAIAKARCDGGVIDVQYEGAVRSSVARYRLAKPPTWYRP